MEFVVSAFPTIRGEVLKSFGKRIAHQRQPLKTNYQSVIVSKKREQKQRFT